MAILAMECKNNFNDSDNSSNNVSFQRLNEIDPSSINSSDDNHNNEKMIGIIESLLFASGEPVSLDKISSVLEIEKNIVKKIIEDMKEYYRDMKRGIMIREINGNYQLYSKLEYGEYVKKLFQTPVKHSLSQAAYETLAIIAYNKPIAKAEIDSIRGVNSESAIAKLIERGLIREAGRMDMPGKPILYETTEEFLRCFGLSSYDDLPPLTDT